MERRDRLSTTEVADVLALADICARADGTAPLAEHVRLALRHQSPPGENNTSHLLIRDADQANGELLGYAYLESIDHDTPGMSELCVHPAHRARGIGGALVSEVVASAPIQLWAHGDHPSAGALAQRYGLVASRLLYRMRRRLDTIDSPKLPAGLTVRTFEVGRDEQSWLDVNARAFAWHPEQGAMTRRDLDQRIAEPWFDPAGLFLAERDGEVVGFHWTKVHQGERPIGEVYVLGVDPSAQGIGLGGVLTDIGLAHLKGLGLDAVLLYVDESNGKAVRLYEKSGFTRWSTDVQYTAS
ncbi:mycothiol synthase [Phytomonospora endophytica]|uniref:Mycothiol acetyltransferase n=1 Tax=Phytomonospora endophytica TaxID=714109 RepID=A0A841FZD9_9ACTN|nr:mycothiol synthase [Phytomonospora endophytica]MBB6038892.1 mycothiol synthase [Phytomonospora endophytica]GIG71556.1 mycothiol acetyltransferase [Phytomonospora endophytica]